MSLHVLKEYQYFAHINHHFAFRCLQIKTLEECICDVAIKAFIDMLAQHTQQLFLRNYFYSHTFQLRHQLFALGKNTMPPIFVVRTSAFLELTEGCFEDHYTERFCGHRTFIIYHPLRSVSFHYIACQFSGLGSFQAQRFLCKNVNQSTTAQLLLVKQVGKDKSRLDMMSQSNKCQFDVFKFDWWILLHFCCICQQFLFPSFLLVLAFNQLCILFLPIELLPQTFYQFSKAIIINPQICFLFVFSILFSFVYFFILSEFVQLGEKRISIQLQLMKGVLQCIMAFLERIVLLIFLLFLVVGKLLCLFEDHILIIVRHGLNLSILCDECGLKLLDFFSRVSNLSLLKDLARFKKVLVVLMEADNRLELLILLLVKLHELVLYFFLLLWQCCNYCFQSDGLFGQILFLYTSLFEDTNMRQLFKLFYLFLRSQIKFIKFLYFFFEDIGIDWLSACFFFSFTHRTFPLLLNSLQKFDFSLVFSYFESQTSHILSLFTQLCFQILVLLGNCLVVLLLKFRIILARFYCQLFFIGGIEQLLQNVLRSKLQVVDAAQLLFSE